MADYNKQVIDEFHANKGNLSGPFSEMDILLVHAVGAKTGKISVFPVAYTKEGDKYVIVASKGGAPTHPDWYYNLLANPSIEVEVGDEKFSVSAESVADPLRDKLYDQHATRYPGFSEYKAKTDRVIPVFLLNRS